MRKYAFLFLVLISCEARSISSSPTALSIKEKKPLLALLPMEDKVHASFSAEMASSFSQAIWKRLEEGHNFILISDSTHTKKDFFVFTELTEHKSKGPADPELSMSIHLKVVDTRAKTPKILLEETLSHKTLLPPSTRAEPSLSLEEGKFRISPLGLAHAKLSREIVTHIEDTIGRAQQG